MKFEKPADLIASLKEANQTDVERYVRYCWQMKTDQRGGNLKNPWFNSKTIEELAHAFQVVQNEGLVFDGVHITWQSTGLSYDYVAYKNKMLIVYPETKIDLQLVYEGDEFTVSKETGKVAYRHHVANPFNQTDDKIIGGYCVIKNNRGEFLTTLGKSEIEKRRKVAKTDHIWKAWFPEMCMKTVMRRATKYHFDDVFDSMNEIDNDHSDPEAVPDEPRVKILGRQILDILDSMEPAEAAGIREQCRKAQSDGNFTEEFAESILKDLQDG